jgi:23S rRNA pseudouridine1911/1915/1917 synthase
MQILYEDNHLLALNKPAGMLSQGDATGDRSVVDWATEDLRRRYQKPGNVYVGLVHRLDRPVSGVIVLAKTSKASARLSEQFREGVVEKVYWAVVEGRITETEGEWNDTLLKDEGRNLVSVVRQGTPGGKVAGLAFRVLERRAETSWIELRPTTGRSHQLRVQVASRGLPIVGDRKYGAKSTLRALDGGGRVALHARELRFRHPTTKQWLSLLATVPADWPSRTGGS